MPKKNIPSKRLKPLDPASKPAAKPMIAEATTGHQDETPPLQGNLGREKARPSVRKAAKRIPLAYALAVTGVAVVAAAVFSSVLTWNPAFQAGRKQVFVEQTKADVKVAAGFQPRLNQAFDELRAGNPAVALKKFQNLQAENPGLSSTAYLIALSALRSKNFALAEEEAARSIRRNERVSDALAIQALIEVQKSEAPDLKKLGDHVLRAEMLLRQAMLADPANPVPMIELAGLLRRQRNSAEAIQLLQAARTRVLPFDLPPYLEATIMLTSLQGTPDEELSSADPSPDLPGTISAAYILMRKGRFNEAAERLKVIQSRTPPSFFRYLLNDPALRPYSQVPELSVFFR